MLILSPYILYLEFPVKTHENAISIIDAS